MAVEIYFRWPNRRSLRQLFLAFLFFGNVAGVMALWILGSHYYIVDSPGEGNFLLALGRLAGLLAQLFLLVQFVMVARIPFVEHSFGFDKLSRFHRWLGYSLVLLLLGHPIILIISGVQSTGQGWLWQLTDYLTNRHQVLLAFLGTVAFLFIIVLSIGFVRRKVHYETWYLTHLVTYLAVGAIFFHQLHTGDLKTPTALKYWYILNVVVFGFLFIYRFVRPWLLLWRFEFRVAQVTQETHDVWSVYIGGRNIKKFKFQPGQYADLRYFSRSFWSQSHPFSFSAGPNRDLIRFSIKTTGDYTSLIPKLKVGTLTLLDGPFGLFTTAEAKEKKLMLIAGGIGITPLRAMLDSLVTEHSDAVLLYANRTSGDIALRNELESYTSAMKLKIIHILGQAEPGFEHGYLDREKIVRLVPDFYEREVFLCGPPPMMKAVQKQLLGLGFTKEHIHFEQFAF